ncbi:Flagellar biosynthetic protein FlhB [Alteripontixanthobacter maritimus]|uniref:Flagellar biosynthetic protein FlhB n=1 Tax=Alteripontixanthobacter maritimus TaxID=2161824 RepID=A0A369Q7I2_9SPHN|nr:flagellar type III secretion system protein FlhB [Alteripontixanthobacter maritimus]RDC59126.1 Flagellar biosynthetic protein FlhB [Alteripontixanthobacter maritimus]
MSDQAGEKSFDPTPKRKADAAKKGDVLRSKELATAVSMAVGGVWLMLAGPWLFGNVGSAARAAFEFERDSIVYFAPEQLMTGLLGSILPPILTLGGVVMIATVASQLGFGEGRFLMGNLAPKGSRLNPANGFKRMFGTQGLVELGKSILKLVLLSGLTAWWAYHNVMPLLRLGDGDLVAQLGAAWDAMAQLLMLLSVGLALIALIDFPIQLLRRLGRLKMTQQDLRDEDKQAEGSPEKRMMIRQRQRKMARGGVAKAVGEAQFILTNPSHFSVAMTYDPELASAPVVLAKGRDEKALAMRELAGELDIPVLEYPALARSVYFTTRENQVIRAELYAAIASILAFVFSLKRGTPIARPLVSVPVELQFDATGKLKAA